MKPEPEMYPGGIAGALIIAAAVAASITAGDTTPAPAQSMTMEELNAMGADEWTAQLKAAEGRFQNCVRSQRTAAWEEFRHPPSSGDPALDAWRHKAEEVALKVADYCKRQEPAAAFNACRLMSPGIEKGTDPATACYYLLEVLTSQVMTGAK